MATTRFASEAEALAKMHEPAITIAAKRMILDARDFIYRERKSKNRDIHAEAVIGTCQDMCPEQERLFRIENNCVHLYEMNEYGEPDEEKMVKEYRRSGADQNEPLPHDLRDGSVMSRTMDYLCLEIVDKIEQADNLGSWYEFVWDRTRCFRKDITLQMLCNSDSVSLIEKCARFHIFCSYYLCTEKPHNFDMKINTKSLADCIQSLKEQYRDLWKKGQFSPNEAEFMAYDILLNMHNFEAVHGLIYFRDQVRQSKQVQLAYKLHSAFQCNDITGFFRLAKSCDFFSLCLLNSVINEFRFTGFNIIRRAFQDRSKNVVQFIKTYIIDLFCFNDEDELNRFCDHYDIEYSDDKISLPRSKDVILGENQSSLLMSRADNLVMPKCRQSFGRAILAYDEHTPMVGGFPLHSSFDNGNYRWSDFVEAPPTQFAKSLPVSESAKIFFGMPNVSKNNIASENSFTVLKSSVFNPFIMKPKEEKKNSTSHSSDGNLFKSIEISFKNTENINSFKDIAKKVENPFKTHKRSFFDSSKNSAHPAPSFSFLPTKSDEFKKESGKKNNIDLNDKDEEEFNHKANEEEEETEVEEEEEEDERIIDELAEAFTEMIFETVTRDILRTSVHERLKKLYKEKLIKNISDKILSESLKDFLLPHVEKAIYKHHQRITTIVYLTFERLYHDCIVDILLPVIEKPIIHELRQRKAKRIRFLSLKFFKLWRFRIDDRTSRKAFFPSIPGVFSVKSNYLSKNYAISSGSVITNGGSLKKLMIGRKTMD